MTPSAAIAHLKQAGKTESAIAAAVGAGQATINRIAAGNQIPNWQLGQALIQLAAATAIPGDDDDPDAGRIATPEEVA